MGIGNKMAGVLATCVSSLPYLQLLNLTDNNLGDEGLSQVIRAISTHKTLEILDVSQNIIGSEAAGALASFVGMISFDIITHVDIELSVYMLCICTYICMVI